MDTKPLEAFAKTSRRELIDAVAARAAAVLAPGSIARTEHAETVRRLEAEIASHGRQHVIDKVAYTWFNRIVALRFMDAKEYTSVGIVSPAAGLPNGQPEILADAKRGHIDDEVVVADAKRLAISGLLDGSRRSTDAEGEAYALLLIEYCRHWNKTMPYMFGHDGDYTDLLIPAGLLAETSVIARARAVLTTEVCDDVEVIGWLYQFYISERKDEVFAGFKKNKKAGSEEIPAATQLFTPHWIVRYLVENSVGRLWLLNRPSSQLIDQMKYYIAPVDEETDFLKITKPEELTVIDPAAGSGHMLTYAFDLLYAIYEEEGYAPSEIPALILTHNISGTEIDSRAGSLAAFALTMKARAKDRRFFARGVQPRICVIEPISFRPDEITMLAARHNELTSEYSFWNQFEHADTFGSLIRPDADQAKIAATVFDNAAVPNDMLYIDTFDRAGRFVQQAVTLSSTYAVVVANPPYMGSKQMNALLSQFMKDEYPDSKSDLFAGFIERCTALAGPQGLAAMITMQSWMFLSSYEKLRTSLLHKQRITSMLHLGARAFDSIGGEVVSSTAFVLANMPPERRGAADALPGTFVRLVEGTSEAEKMSALDQALGTKSTDTGFHLASDADFMAIPGSPIVYWLSEKMRAAFALGKQLGEVAEPRQGLATADNNRFLRQWWEVAADRTGLRCDSRTEAAKSGLRWFPYNKGGDFRRWYGNQEFVVNWEHDGAEIRAFGTEDGGRPRSRAQNTSAYFSPSVSWSKISSGAPAFRAYPPGFIFDVAGTSMFADTQRERDALIAFTNSQVAYEQLSAVAPTMNFEVGQVAGLPVTDETPDETVGRVSALVEQSKTDWDAFETSWDFTENPLIMTARRTALE